MVRAIVGANWGDEGKGKITDMFAGQSDIVIRFQGGANAGHTIINERGRFAFHLMPSGVCYDHTTCIIGNGVALDINKFFNELEDVKKAGPVPLRAATAEALAAGQPVSMDLAERFAQAVKEDINPSGQRVRDQSPLP